ncbi:hypothetical protein MHU86_1265 [Fragilaria crotonensis]|nr:hypothetical protein MHU86_1265 [Fragilaria crotonensis]
MSNKRKNAASPTTMCSWEETKARLESVECNSWLMQLQQCVTVLGQKSGGPIGSAGGTIMIANTANECGVMHEQIKELQESSRRVRESLQDQIDHERKAFAEESDDLYMIVQQSNELESLLSEYNEKIAQLEEAQVKLRASVHHHKEMASKQTEEMDQVELDRMHQVPKIKNQISLYAKTTGIKWDYHRDHVLAGQVAIPSRGVVSRFSIDPREYDSFQIANYLWSAMEGEVAPAIRAT